MIGMDNVTYYARFSHCSDESGNHICVFFPDVPQACTNGDTIEDATKRAMDILSSVLDVSDGCIADIYSPSTLDELKKEAKRIEKERINFWDDEDIPDGYELSYEFVPITITPINNNYLRVMKSKK